MIFIYMLMCIELVAADYWTDRTQLLSADFQQSIGSSIKLNDKEMQANNILMAYKLQEFDEGFKNPTKFLAGEHFFKSKPLIEKTKVFELIKKLPKGGVLHSHDTSLVSEEFLFELTTRDNLYACILKNDIKLHFFRNNSIDPTCNWQLVKTLRETDTKFNETLRKVLTLVVDDPATAYPDINTIWKIFIDIFRRATPLITYKPVFKEYFYQALKELYEDNVSYLEFRTTLPKVYDLDGNTLGPVEIVGLYEEVKKAFLKDYPDFLGAKLVYAPSRHVDNKTMDYYVATFKELQAKYPDFIAGFDLVGQEDLGFPLIDFINDLLNIKNAGANFMFHAGETDWYGQSTDLNLVDAVLLGAKRIGHGYALLKHPAVADIVKKSKIAVEVSPISNQVLKLVDDLRNHPANILIANNYEVVISNDDPCFWGSKGLSFDFYMAFMGMSSRNSDLRLLKQLAMNSLIHSTLPDKEKVLTYYQQKWDRFINELIGENSTDNEVRLSLL